MARVERVRDIAVESPWLVEGLPGAGLVGKIACDHLINTFDMEYIAGIHCDGLPEVAVYTSDSHSLRPPVRLYADEERNLLVLQSDVPVSPSSASEFAGCITSLIAEMDATPIYISGLDEQWDDVPAVYGVGVESGIDLVSEAGLAPPVQTGLVSGPTGALLAAAEEQNLTAVGLITQANVKFPDPQAARTTLKDGVTVLTGIEVETETLVDQAEEIQKAREQLAERLHQAGDESSQAQSLRGFH
jgi:uncharacterized protein